MLHELVHVGVLIVVVQGSTDTRLTLTGGNYKWNLAGFGCQTDSTFAGKNIFKDCQPDSCNPNLMQGRIARLDRKPPDEIKIWLNAVVVRSPAMQYYGCYQVKPLDAITKHTEFSNNDVLECSVFCLSEALSGKGDFILLKNYSCYCVPSKTQSQWSNLGNRNLLEYSSKDCNLKCPGNEYNQCGGKDSDQLVSFYKFVIISQEPIFTGLGQYCFYAEKNLNTVKYDTCCSKRKFKCQKIVKTDGSTQKAEASCFHLFYNWYEAQKKCQEESGRFLQNYLPGKNNCKDSKDLNDEQTWHNRFISEKIIWDPEKDTNLREKFINHKQCLALQIAQNQTYKFITMDCDKSYPALCQIIKDETKMHNSTTENSNKTVTIGDSTRHSVNESTKSNSTLATTDDANNQSSQNNSTSGTIIGSISAAVAILLLVGVSVAFIRRRIFKSQNKLDSYDKVYYSTAENNTDGNNILSEAEYTYTNEIGQNMLTRKDNDVYNHVGEKIVHCEPERITVIYDHAGVKENEYDVSNVFQKRNDTVVEGVYDQTKSLESDYDTTSTQNIIIDNDTEAFYDHT